jgi:hypothetical protein
MPALGPSCCETNRKKCRHSNRCVGGNATQHGAGRPLYEASFQAGQANEQHHGVSGGENQSDRGPHNDQRPRIQWRTASRTVNWAGIGTLRRNARDDADQYHSPKTDKRHRRAEKEVDGSMTSVSRRWLGHESNLKLPPPAGTGIRPFVQPGVTVVPVCAWSCVCWVSPLSVALIQTRWPVARAAETGGSEPSRVTANSVGLAEGVPLVRSRRLVRRIGR